LHLIEKGLNLKELEIEELMWFFKR
jgi:hypothetical protein